ncbi:MAG: sortase, partial [Acidimicrobiales bacterium]
GDAIEVTTRQGAFLYEVTGSVVIRPSQRNVLLDAGDDRLTLTTCHPKFRATQRLVVTAVFRGSEPLSSA